MAEKCGLGFEGCGNPHCDIKYTDSPVDSAYQRGLVSGWQEGHDAHAEEIAALQTENAVLRLALEKTEKSWQTVYIGLGSRQRIHWLGTRMRAEMDKLHKDRFEYQARQELKRGEA